MSQDVRPRTPRDVASTASGHGLPRRPIWSIALVGILACGCSTPAATPAATARSTATTIGPLASAAPSPGATEPGPPVAASFPVASLDPSMSAEELFAETATADEIDVVELGSETRDSAVVRDMRFAGSRGALVEAWLVEPPSGDARAGVLFLHWRGEHDSDRGEFLDEAVELAGSGVASILITQVFPFVVGAEGLDHDRVEIGRQVRDARRALALLRAKLGDAPVAVVGHDFGGMYAAILCGLDPGLDAIVVMTPTTTWANWFIDFVHVVPAAEAPAYRAGLEDVDPITWIAGGADTPLLLQFAAADVFVPRSVVEGFTAAVGDLADARTYTTNHPLDEAARSDRIAWLLDELGID